MLGIYWLGEGLDWISNICHAVPWCAMLKMCHVWELIIQVWQSPGISRKGGGGKQSSAISPSCLALCWQCCCALSACSHTTGVWPGALGAAVSPLLVNITIIGSFFFLAWYWAGTGRAGANLWIQCKSRVVLPLKSALFPLHLRLCYWDPDWYKVTGAFLALFCFLWLILIEDVRFHSCLNQHRCFSEQKFPLWAKANTVS